MTEPEDQVRRYADAVARSQRPVDLAEIAGRRRGRRPRRVLVGAAAVLCVALVVGFVIVEPGRRHRTIVEVSPSPSTVSIPFKSAGPCVADALTVTSAQGERLHPDVLPPGFVLTEGDETDLGARGQLTYTTRAHNDPPRVELLRYHTYQQLAQLSAGTSHHSVTVQGHAGLVSDGAPGGFIAVAWTTAPGIALVVSGYKLPEAEVRTIAEGVRYTPGTTFRYPVHVGFITREDAIARVDSVQSAPTAVLSSLGEVEALTSRSLSELSVVTPVWVVSAPAAPSAFVIDASSGTLLGSVPSRGKLDALTDRSTGGCELPLGVLTRSEVLALHPAESGVTLTAKMTTLTDFAATGVGAGFTQCMLTACDANVPVWVLVSTATDQRFTDEMRGPVGRPRNTTPGSWQVIAVDARTGPQDTDLATMSLGAGSPPAALGAIKDLAGP